MSMGVRILERMTDAKIQIQNLTDQLKVTIRDKVLKYQASLNIELL